MSLLRELTGRLFENFFLRYETWIAVVTLSSLAGYPFCPQDISFLLVLLCLHLSSRIALGLVGIRFTVDEECGAIFPVHLTGQLGVGGGSATCNCCLLSCTVCHLILLI